MAGALKVFPEDFELPIALVRFADLFDSSQSASREGVLLINPQLPEAEADAWRKIWDSCPRHLRENHIGILTSGTSGSGGRCILLSHRALKASADAVNRHLEFITNSSASAWRGKSWLLSLPVFHVGGLGILFRAHAANMSICYSLANWSPTGFAAALGSSEAIFSSLVPTQLFDLVGAGIRPPKTLQTVIIGGASLDPALSRKAQLLGWPLVASYGMTEMSSQIATGTLDQPLYLRLLGHVETSISEDSILRVRGPSMLSGWLDFRGTRHDIDGAQWFLTEDRVRIRDGDVLEPLGRANDVVKICGENVDLSTLRRIWREACVESNLEMLTSEIFFKKADRSEHQVILFVEAGATRVDREISTRLRAAIDRYHALVLPVARLFCVSFGARIPRTPAGKTPSTVAI